MPEAPHKPFLAVDSRPFGGEDQMDFSKVAFDSGPIGGGRRNGLFEGGRIVTT